jgi:DNA-binding Lrp family transcriptional regulator
VFREAKKVSVDEVDLNILRELLIDAQQSHREIARKIGVSAGTVVARKRRMEEEGMIKGYVAQLDHEKLGFDLTVVTEVTVSSGKVLEVGEDIAKIPQATAVYNITGGSDVVVIGKFKTRNDLSNFTKKILKIPNVERTNTHLVLITLKEDIVQL